MSIIENDVTVELGLESVQSLLDWAKLDMDATHAHGMLVGGICGDFDMDQTDYLVRLFGLSEQAWSSASQSHAHFAETLYLINENNLKSVDFRFQLQLPDDSYPLSERVESLSSWVDGFLTSFGLCGIAIESMSEELQEVMGELIQIAHVDLSDVTEDEQDNESAYAEIVEYVRMVVIFIYSELHAEHLVEQEEAELQIH